MVRRGLEHAVYHQLPSGLSIKVFSSPWFLAAKLTAYEGRGKGDVLMSNDIEDIMALVDGREELVDELRVAPEALQHYVAEEISRLMTNPVFESVIQSTAQGSEREALIYARLESVIKAQRPA